jgi:glycosyltransferase involved in cell wall biosynthesis
VESASPDTGWSVIVCAYTFERLELTTACIRAVMEQPERPEVIVVTDYNDDLGRVLQERFPTVRVVSNEQRQGLGGARNSGVAAASHDLVAFVDDDAEPTPRWLSELGEPFADPAVAVVGGDAQPVWQGDVPAWFPDEYLWVVGCSYRGMAREGPVRNPLGCNMAFRRQSLIDVGGFDETLGRLGSLPFGLEETELCVRLTNARPSSRIVMARGAVVRHHVPPGRQRPGYFFQRCFYEGIGKSQLRELASSQALSAERSYALTVLPAAVFRDLAGVVRLDDPLARLKRIGAIVGGLASAAAGYGWGRLRSIRTRSGRAAVRQASPAAPDD